MKARFASILIVFLTCSSFKPQQPMLETGWYFLTENTQTGVTFEDIDSHKNVIVEKLPFVNIGDIKNVKLADEIMFGFKIKKLKLKLTRDGNKKWDLATTKMSNEKRSAVFVFENEVFCHLTVIDKAGYVSPSRVDNDINSPKLRIIYESMPESLRK